jgi:hypothetical protein
MVNAEMGGLPVGAARDGGAPQRTSPAEGFLRHRGLIGLCAGLAIVEAVLLLLLAPAALSLAPQVTALPPLAVFHDLRWLFGYNRSWLEFAVGAGVLVAGRAALDTVLVRLAWPRGLQAPSARATFLASLAFTLLAGLLMLPIVTLVFGVAVLPFSWPFLAAVPVLVFIALPLSHGGVTPTWWQRLPPGRAVGWVVACFFEYSLLGIVLPRLPAGGVVAVAALAGVVNARAWYGLSAAMARPVRPRHHRLLAWIPVAPVAAVSVFALAIGTTRLIFDAAATAPHVGIAAASSAGLAAAAGSLTPPPKAAPGHGRHQAVLVIAGFGSSCCHTARGLQRAVPDLLVQQFSYLGLNAAGKPLAQGPGASNMPLPELGDEIAAQVQKLYEQTGHPVDLVAESEGTLGVDAAFARHPGIPVGSVILLSPIVAPGQATFPQPGQQGRGVAGGYALGVLDRLVGEMSPFGAAGAGQLIDSVNSVGARYAAAVTTKGASAHWLAVVPLADAVTLPACSLPQNVLFVPAFHGGLLGDPPVLGMVRDFLHGRQVTGGQSLREAAELLSSAASAWRMPESSVPSATCPA